jgi:hypothetical protein
MRADLPVREPFRRQRQDHLVHTAQTPLTLLDQLRLEGPGPIPRHSDLDRPRLGDHRLGPVPVAVVLPAALGPLTVLVAQVIGELALQRGLQHPLRQLLQQAAFPGELHPTGLSPGHQLSHQPVIHGARPTHSGLPGPDVTCHVSHQLSLPARELHHSPYRPRRKPPRRRPHPVVRDVRRTHEAGGSKALAGPGMTGVYQLGHCALIRQCRR